MGLPKKLEPKERESPSRTPRDVDGQMKEDSEDFLQVLQEIRRIMKTKSLQKKSHKNLYKKLVWGPFWQVKPEKYQLIG